jgi:hypothetical protein
MTISQTNLSAQADETTLTNATGTLAIKSKGVSASYIADNTITASQIAVGTLENRNMLKGLTPTTSGGTWTNIPNMIDGDITTFSALDTGANASCTLIFDIGSIKNIKTIGAYFENFSGGTAGTLGYSTDGNSYTTDASFTTAGTTNLLKNYTTMISARYIKLTFTSTTATWRVYEITVG